MGRGPSQPIINNQKWCNSCSLWLSLDQFDKDNQRRTGYHPYCKSCRQKQRRTHYQQHTDLHLERQRKYNYGMEANEYQALFHAQKGVCAACKQPETGTRYGKIMNLAVDHCHVTGKVRALLCNDCNRALGILKDDPERVKQLLDYISEQKRKLNLDDNATDYVKF